MNKQQAANPLKPKNKGQSLVELTLVLTIILTLLVGMVEFGNLLNQYINVVDGAREGARFGSNDNPFETINGVSNYEPFFAKIYTVVEGAFDIDGNRLSKGAINPIVLSAANGDDIVVAFFSATGDSRRGPPNTCTPPATVQNLVRFTPNPPSRYQTQTSQITDAQVLARIDGCAPNTGVLLVEVFYHYGQILRLYAFLGIPDPILVHAYSIMPLSSAEPTPTP